MTVAQKARAGRQPRAYGGQHFIRAGGGDAIGLGEEHGFQIRVAAAPLGDFEAGAKLGFRFVE